MFWFALGCTSVEPPESLFELESVVAKVRPGTPDPERWASATLEALRGAKVEVDARSVCQVLAVIEQESGYQSNPGVPGISGMVRTELLESLSVLGPMDEAALDAVLELKVDGSQRTLREQLDDARTERDLDRLYRAILDHLKVGAVGRALIPARIDRANPVRTLGSMQVQLDYAHRHRVDRAMSRVELRESLYTIDGGVRYGTLRLFDTDASYDDPIFRFADFNAGPYASRNAAFQRQLQTLSGKTVTSDGDLLVYNGRGKPTASQHGQTVTVLTDWAARHQPDLSAEQIVADLRTEKTAAFTSTTTWATVRQAFAEHVGREPAHAILPDVALDSPKLAGTWTTAHFAQRVDRRYHACLER